MQKVNSKRLWWLLVGVALTACAKQQAFSIDGVKDKFCVPKGYPPKDAWFIPKASPEAPRGFSFMGCRLLDEETRKACALPDVLISASAIPLSVDVNQTWDRLKGAAVLHSVVSSPGVTYEIDSTSNRLKVYNEQAWPAWFVWRKAPSSDGAQAPLDDSDELIMSCSGANTFPGGDGGVGSKGEFVCERYVRGKEYALKYKFISKDPIPTDERTLHLEGELFGQIDRWRCQD